MLGVTALMEKCDRLQKYYLQLEKYVIPLQTQVAELQTEFRSSFKSTTTLKKKNDDLNVAVSTVYGRFWHETFHHTSKVEKLRSLSLVDLKRVSFVPRKSLSPPRRLRWQSKRRISLMVT